MLTATPLPAAPLSAAPLSTGSTHPAAAPRVRSFTRWATEPSTATVPLVRSRVRAVLGGWRVTADVADVLLLAVSELVANVVLHAATPGRLRVGVTLREGWLQLDVADGATSSPRLPHPRTEVDLDAEDGRGLLIVQLMAAESGGELSVVTGAFGKSVRVRIPAP